MMNGLPYYKAYPRDFIEGTVGMSFELKGAYRLVLDLIYLRSGKLPDDGRYISGVLGCSIRSWNKYRAALIQAGKIVVSNGMVSNFRADKELETSRTFQDKQAENARQPRKNNGLEKPRLSHTDTDTEQDKEISLTGPSAMPAKSLDAEVYRVGKLTLGKNAGGVITELRKACEYDDAYTLEILNRAAEKHEPMAWVKKAIKGIGDRPYRNVAGAQAAEQIIESKEDREWRKREAEIYRNVL